MATFGTKEQILAEITTLHTALAEGNLSIEQLDQLVNLSQELHQRHIILRYKVFETQVLSKQATEEENESELATPELEVEAPSIEMDLFAEPEVAEIPLFDFSAEIEEPAHEIEEEVELEIPIEATLEDEQEEEQIIPSETEESIEVIHPIQEEVIDLFSIAQEDPIADQFIQEEPAPVVYQSEVYQQAQPEPTLIHSEEIVTETDFGRTVEQHTVVENAETHEVVQEKHTTETMSADEQTISRFLAKFREIEKDNDASLAFAKIDSLTSAFGLNERLLFINELFGGSSEAFNNAIQVLDNQESGIDAFLRLAEIGTLNHWNVDISTVVDFMKKVSKRYSN